MTDEDDKKMDCSFGWHGRPSRIPKPVVDVKIGDLIISVVVVRRCAQTMLKSDLVPPHIGEEDTLVSMICMHGALYTYQRRCVIVTVMGEM